MKTNILKKIGEMSEDRGVTHPLQQGQNFDRRRDFLKTKSMDMDTYGSISPGRGKWSKSGIFFNLFLALL